MENTEQTLSCAHSSQPETKSQDLSASTSSSLAEEQNLNQESLSRNICATKEGISLYIHTHADSCRVADSKKCVIYQLLSLHWHIRKIKLGFSPEKKVTQMSWAKIKGRSVKLVLVSPNCNNMPSVAFME